MVEGTNADATDETMVKIFSRNAESFEWLSKTIRASETIALLKRKTIAVQFFSKIHFKKKVFLSKK